MKKLLALAALAFASIATLSAQNRPMAQAGPAPTVDQDLSLKRVGSPEISPDGRSVAYTIRETNWDDNAYETEIWLADSATGAVHQLTALFTSGVKRIEFTPVCIGGVLLAKLKSLGEPLNEQLSSKPFWLESS